MRALCGAIITAGALICLGLASVGLGLRYQNYPYLNPEGQPQFVRMRDIDTTLMLVLVSGLVVLGIGLATAFVGLAYHHYRRHHEMLHLHRTQDRTPA
jgi:hypothetical protein